MLVRKGKASKPPRLDLAMVLPSEILRESAQRLQTAAFVWIALWTTGLVMNNIVGPRVSPDRPLDDAWPWPANPVAFGCILVSTGLVLYTRRHSLSPRYVLNLALAYELVLAFAIGLVNQWTPNVHGLSWICVLLLVHPLLVPNAPIKTLVVGLMAASMDLVGIAIAATRGISVPPAQVLVWTYLPNYICAIIAVVPAKILTQLSHEVHEAQELGSYKLDELLGRGGMGEIYRAEHRMLARPAAIKLIRPELLGKGVEEQRRVIQRFEREARVTARMCSPHTINVYDFGIADDGTFYYVMELLAGFNLETFVRRFGPPPASRTIHFLEQVCASLEEAHDSGLIHRDIKPANVYVCRYGVKLDFIKVLDFGFVKPTAVEEQDVTLTVENVIGGTPAFMAPEQAIGNLPTDGRSDLYSVGCLGYWLLTGQVVFEGTTPLEVIAQHAKTAPLPPSRRSEIEIPASLEKVIMACLQKDPRHRPQTARALAEMLAGLDVERWDDAKAQAWWTSLAPLPVGCAP